ncbi:DUF1707 SHOCT-like domain-containing protein [Jiangella mangrovi]|uniref:DUF1707 domain-containing protein n=1 Tax=Jiangella mangrovi TaxID=1524084 RepID=A0A7W9LLF6_9ACTN|nr:DUF1707 domain-containing protein [Jiangella mangrovi]MBB5788052.1 hypothetical protein [Jiangella mangrovi]
MAGGRAARPPGDDDRARYTTVLDAARAEGRIDDAELSRRSFTVRYAQTMGELDAVVDDLPGPTAAAAAGRSPLTWALAGIAVAAAVVIGIVVGARDGEGEDDTPAGGQVEVVDPPPVAEEEAAPPDMYSLADLTAMWDALGTAQVPGVLSVYLHSEWADLDVQADPGVPFYDEAEYDGELQPFEPGGQVSGEPEAEFFPLDAVDPAVVAAVADRADDVAGYAGRPISLIVVERDVFYGDIVTIRVHLEADAYGVSPSLTWDASGQHLLDDGSDA